MLRHSGNHPFMHAQCTYTHTHIQSFFRLLTHPLAHKRTHTHTCMHMRTQTRTHIHTHNNRCTVRLLVPKEDLGGPPLTLTHQAGAGRGDMGRQLTQRSNQHMHRIKVRVGSVRPVICTVGLLVELQFIKSIIWVPHIVQCAKSKESLVM